MREKNTRKFPTTKKHFKILKFYLDARLYDPITWPMMDMVMFGSKEYCMQIGPSWVQSTTPSHCCLVRWSEVKLQIQFYLGSGGLHLLGCSA